MVEVEVVGKPLVLIAVTVVVVVSSGAKVVVVDVLHGPITVQGAIRLDRPSNVGRNA